MRVLFFFFFSGVEEEEDEGGERRDSMCREVQVELTIINEAREREKE